MSENDMYKMLWIEDDYDRLKNLMRPLSKKNFCINHAHSLEKFSLIQDINTYDLFVVDIMIPQFENNNRIQLEDFEPYPGLKVIEQLVKYDKPIVVLSVVTDPAVTKIIESYKSNIKFLTKGNIFPSDFKYEIFEMLNIED